MMEPSAISRLIRAGLVTGVTDGLFSSVLSAFFYGSTVTRLFQGVAAVLMGTAALDGGARTAAVGLLMHFGVAFGWSAVFLVSYLSSSWIRSLAGSSAGVIAIAAVYGPLIWIVMSMAIVPLFTHRPPTINIRWWVQFFGHIPFVALPIVTMIGRTA
jgi:uncharacterized membrane protein YagU involved in acid resistance